VTDEGIHTAKVLVTAIDTVDTRLLGQLGDAERATFRQVLTTLAALDDSDGDPEC